MVGDEVLDDAADGEAYYGARAVGAAGEDAEKEEPAEAAAEKADDLVECWKERY